MELIDIGQVFWSPGRVWLSTPRSLISFVSNGSLHSRSPLLSKTVSVLGVPAPSEMMTCPSRKFRVNGGIALKLLYLRLGVACEPNFRRACAGRDFTIE